MAVAGTKTDNGIETQRDNRGAGVGRCAQQRAQVTRVRRLACCGSAAPACDRVRVHACCARAAVPARRSVGGRRGEPAHFADAFDLSMATSLAASSMTVLWRASRLFSELRPFHHSMNSASESLPFSERSASLNFIRRCSSLRKGKPSLAAASPSCFSSRYPAFALSTDRKMSCRSVKVAALSVAPRLSATGPPNSPMYSCATLICLAFSALAQPSSSAISAATRGMACFAASELRKASRIRVVSMSFTLTASSCRHA
mmetsp:Transcript_33541/g.102511  ORF Transcript_33541/g.102511 Transcript_33541/m.102511 type:complete len:258 (+) Transcript_33541:698-1471(+)